MKNENKTVRWIYFFILKSIRIPALFMLLGIACTMLSLIDDYLNLKKWGHEILHINEWGHLLNIFEPIGQTIIVMSALAAIYRFITLFCQHKEHDFQQRNAQLPVLILKTLQKGLRIFYIFTLLYTAVLILGADHIYFVYLNKIIYVLLLLTVCWVLLEIIETVQHVILHYTSTTKSQDPRRAKDWHTKAQVIRNLSTVIIVFLTISAVLMSFDSVKNIGLSLLASAGFLTAIIGLSAQKTLVSFFSGIQIAFSERIKIGDYIVIDGQHGVIEQITLTYVALKIDDNRRLIIPIGFFIDKPFENWSREGDTLKGEIFLYTTYEVSLPVIREELIRYLQSKPLWDGKIAKAQLSRFKDSTIEVRLRFSANDPDRLGELKSGTREHMLDFLRSHHANFLPKTSCFQNSESDDLHK